MGGGSFLWSNNKILNMFYMEFLFHKTRKIKITYLIQGTFQFAFVISVNQINPLKNFTNSIISNGLYSFL